MNSRLPLIGITTADRDEELVTSPWYAASFSVPSEYVDAVRRAGGNPVLLPPGEQDWAQWLAIIDGFIVTGGSDVDAARYGGDPDHPRQEKPRVDRDMTELALAERLMEGSTPALFVCRGLQVLNVATGGTLNQHVADSLDQDIHRLEGEGWTYHDVEVKAGSLVAKAMGCDVASGATGHHQAIDEVGTGLEPVAWAADGIVEAVEVEGDTWMMGVQWHPEVTAESDASQQGLFDALVAAASGAER